MPENSAERGDLDERYQQALAREGTPAERFGHFVRFFMEEGIRPPGKPKQLLQWTPKELAGAIRRNEKSIENMLIGEQVPPYKEDLEFVFLGNKPSEDTPQRGRWCSDFRRRHQEARDFNLVRVRQRPRRILTNVAEAFTLEKARPCKRDPILHWHFADADRKRNQYLDEEPEPVDFYVSVGAFKNAGSQITLRMRERPGSSLNLKSIILVRLHPKLVQRLEVADLLHNDFEAILQSRIAAFVGDVGKDPRQLPIFVRLWQEMPSFHGYLFSRRRFTNHWGFDEGKLHVDIPLLEYPSPDWDIETREAIRTMADCELAVAYRNGKRVR